MWTPGQLSLAVVLREQNSRKATHARKVAVAFSFKGVKEYKQESKQTKWKEPHKEFCKSFCSIAFYGMIGSSGIFFPPNSYNVCVLGHS